jgi:hypothetical protein
MEKKKKLSEISTPRYFVVLFYLRLSVCKLYRSCWMGRLSNETDVVPKVLYTNRKRESKVSAEVELIMRKRAMQTILCIFLPVIWLHPLRLREGSLEPCGHSVLRDVTGVRIYILIQKRICSSHTHTHLDLRGKKALLLLSL